MRHRKYAGVNRKSALLELWVLDGHDPLRLSVDYDDVDRDSVDEQLEVLLRCLDAANVLSVTRSAHESLVKISVSDGVSTLVGELVTTVNQGGNR